MAKFRFHLSVEPNFVTTKEVEISDELLAQFGDFRNELVDERLREWGDEISSLTWDEIEEEGEE